MPLRHVHVDDAEFLHIQIIQTDHRRDADAPIHRTERSVAMKQIKRKRKSLVEKNLAALAEKIAAAGPRGTDVGGRGQAAAVEKRVAGGREIQKSLLADDGHVALHLF